MKAVIQRVDKASVTVGETVSGAIEIGYLILLGVAEGDSRKDAEKLCEKIPVLRIFMDEQGKMNRSLTDVGGSILAVSQFTLCADCTHGRRPSFTGSAPADRAEALYEYFIDCLRQKGIAVATGVFGAHMEVSLVNNGPVTILLDSKEIKG